MPLVSSLDERWLYLPYLVPSRQDAPETTCCNMSHSEAIRLDIIARIAVNDARHDVGVPQVRSENPMLVRECPLGELWA